MLSDYLINPDNHEYTSTREKSWSFPAYRPSCGTSLPAPYEEDGIHTMTELMARGPVSLVRGPSMPGGYEQFLLDTMGGGSAEQGVPLF